MNKREGQFHLFYDGDKDEKRKREEADEKNRAHMEEQARLYASPEGKRKRLINNLFSKIKEADEGNFTEEEKKIFVEFENNIRIKKENNSELNSEELDFLRAINIGDEEKDRRQEMEDKSPRYGHH